MLFAEIWEDDWGPAPHLTDVTVHSNGPPTPLQVIEYLDGRFRLNRRAYHMALDILFPQPRDEQGGNAITARIPVFQRIVPTASWRRTANWEGGVVPVDRQWGPSRADDAADTDAKCDSDDEERVADRDLAVCLAELRGIRDHNNACLDASSTSAPVTATSETMSDSSSAVHSASTPSSPGSSASHKRSREDSCEADGEQSSSDSSSSPEDRPRVRRRLTSRSDVPPPHALAERREAARERLRTKLRKHRDQSPPLASPGATSDLEAVGLSPAGRVVARPGSPTSQLSSLSSHRIAASSSSSQPLESDRSEAATPRSLKRSRRGDETEETSVKHPVEGDDRQLNEERKKKSKRE